MGSVSTASTDIERDRAGVNILDGENNWSRPRASEVIGEQVIVCDRSAKWWEEEAKEAVRIKAIAHVRQ